MKYAIGITLLFITLMASQCYLFYRLGKAEAGYIPQYIDSHQASRLTE